MVAANREWDFENGRSDNSNPKSQNLRSDQRQKMTLPVQFEILRFRV